MSGGVRRVGGTDHDDLVNASAPVPTAPSVVHRYISTTVIDAPDRIVTESGTIIAPVGFYLTFDASNALVKVTVEGAVVREGVRIDWEHIKVFPFDWREHAEGWLGKAASLVSPVPTRPGRYVEYDDRNKVYPTAYGLNALGEWFSPSGEIKPSALPQGLVAK